MTARGRKAVRSNVIASRLLLALAQADLVADEKLAADDEEEDDARQDIGEGVVQAEHAGDLARAAAQNHDKKAREDHHDGVELGHPGDHDRCEAASADDGGGQRVVRTGGEQQADEAADRAGEDHRAHDDALDLDARIARGALALTDNGDLIAVLAVIEIDVHNAREDRHKQDREEIALAAENGEPAGLGILVDDTDLTGSLGNLPYYRIKCHQLSSYVVHHQRRQCLIGIPFRLEKCGNEAPDGSCCQTCHDHAQDHNCVRKLISQTDHTGCCCQPADQHLSLTADIPEFHLKCRSQCQCDQKQDRYILKSDPGLADGSESTQNDGLIYL